MHSEVLLQVVGTGVFSLTLSIAVSRGLEGAQMCLNSWSRSRRYHCPVIPRCLLEHFQ